MEATEFNELEDLLMEARDKYPRDSRDIPSSELAGLILAAGFRRPIIPSDDEREALANLIPLDLIRDRDREGFPRDAFEAADRILAAGFRYTALDGA